MSDSVQKYSASRMGSAPIGPLLLSCSVPMMISMLVQALYNIVDSIFVSHVNEAALSAVSLAFPIQNLMIAFAVPIFPAVWVRATGPRPAARR